MAASIHCEVVQSIDSSGTLNIFVICLDRVGSEHNIIDWDFGLALARAVYDARTKIENGEIDVVVLCSAKKGSFMAGADILTEMKYIGVQGQQRSYQKCRQLQNIFCALESLPVPTVAILNGTTLGGGLELALACDYRIADAEQCNQIGLPEVQIGVLPGGGGCVRLPHLIGFRQSLNLLLTGKPITAKKALEMGIVDDITSETATILKSGSKKAEDMEESTRCYQYNWLLKFLDNVDCRKIGKRPFYLKEKFEVQKHEVRCEDPKLLSEEELLADVRGESNLWEEKCQKKYPRKTGRFRAVCDYLVNLFLYILALIQLRWKVGTLMPAPFICLQTMFRCFYAGNWLEAMSLDAQGFATLITTAESKSLMNLFLVTRKLKKCALNFGLGESDQPQPFSKDSDCVVVLISKRGLEYASAYVQSLMYSGLKVSLIDVHNVLAKEKVCSTIREGYKYALKRRYITEEEVNVQFDGFTFHKGNDLAELESFVRGRRVVVVDALINNRPDSAPGKMVEEIQKCTDEVVEVSLLSNGPSHSMSMMVMSVGDPQRKNTLCVEITPPTNKFPTEHLRTVSSLVAATGKIPVITPGSSFGPASLYLTLSFWNLAVSLLNHFRGSLTEKKIDSILCKAGFTKGPFATMKELDHVYVLKLVDPFVSQFNDLSRYLSGGKNSYRDGRRRPPSDSDLAQLFMIHVGLVAAQMKRQNPTISESAMDVLCVSGLIHFPPSEGGPLNFIVRLGQVEIVKLFEDIVSRISNGRALFGNRDIVGISGITEDGVYGSLFNAHQSSNPKDASDYLKQRNESNLLSSKELHDIGVTHGLQNQQICLILSTSYCLALLCVFGIGIVLLFGVLAGYLVLIM